ncbi:uncharacterized protein MONOS_17575 [Monocercomonoides exilis]|uniref:uncharacterized protein n=1 Tax=Monocercomonoides exilis TaxID=2049356 RepID=UPI00355A84DB|nr:hypothetical protein MONOS_17575 [Monocercomonoides exilis]
MPINSVITSMAYIFGGVTWEGISEEEVEKLHERTEKMLKEAQDYRKITPCIDSTVSELVSEKKQELRRNEEFKSTLDDDRENLVGKLVRVLKQLLLWSDKAYEAATSEAKRCSNCRLIPAEHPVPDSCYVACSMPGMADDQFKLRSIGPASSLRLTPSFVLSSPRLVPSLVISHEPNLHLSARSSASSCNAQSISASIPFSSSSSSSSGQTSLPSSASSNNSSTPRSSCQVPSASPLTLLHPLSPPAQTLFSLHSSLSSQYTPTALSPVSNRSILSPFLTPSAEAGSVRRQSLSTTLTSPVMSPVPLLPLMGSPGSFSSVSFSSSSSSSSSSSLPSSSSSTTTSSSSAAIPLVPLSFAAAPSLSEHSTTLHGFDSSKMQQISGGDDGVSCNCVCSYCEDATCALFVLMVVECLTPCCEHPQLSASIVQLFSSSTSSIPSIPSCKSSARNNVFHSHRDCAHLLHHSHIHAHSHSHSHSHLHTHNHSAASSNAANINTNTTSVTNTSTTLTSITAACSDDSSLESTLPGSAKCRIGRCKAEEEQSAVVLHERDAQSGGASGPVESYSVAQISIPRLESLQQTVTHSLNTLRQDEQKATTATIPMPISIPMAMETTMEATMPDQELSSTSIASSSSSPSSPTPQPSQQSRQQTVPQVPANAAATISTTISAAATIAV